MTNDNIETNSPELRAAVLAQVLSHVASTPGPVAYDAIFNAVLSATGKSEEECSLEITRAALFLASSGLIVSNTFDRGFLTIGADTTFTAAPHITGWIWRDFDVEQEEEL